MILRFGLEYRRDGRGVPALAVLGRGNLINGEALGDGGERLSGLALADDPMHDFARKSARTAEPNTLGLVEGERIRSPPRDATAARN